MFTSLSSSDLVIAAAMAAIFVAPTIYHLASDLRTRPSRHFSLVPHKVRHLLATILRLGFIVGATALSSSASAPGVSAFIWFLASATLLAWALLGVTDRRLHIHADTGLITWRKISLPVSISTELATFVDAVAPLRFDRSDKTMDLFGIASLQRHWTVNYNGSVSSSGHYSVSMLHHIAQSVNDYLTAFARHDSDARQSRRAHFRDEFLRAQAPARDRAESRRERKRQEADARARRQAERKAAKVRRAAQARQRRVDEKFGASS